MRFMFSFSLPEPHIADEARPGALTERGMALFSWLTSQPVGITVASAFDTRWDGELLGSEPHMGEFPSSFTPCLGRTTQVS